jgi:alpha-galactosidase
VWTSGAAGSKGKYVAVFNVGAQESAGPRVEWKDLGLAGPRTARDLWAHRDLGRLADALVVTLPPHGAAMFLVQERSEPALAAGEALPRSQERI